MAKGRHLKPKQSATLLRPIDVLTPIAKPQLKPVKKWELQTIKDLYTESEKARTPTTTPFGKYKAGCWSIFLATIKSAY